MATYKYTSLGAGTLNTGINNSVTSVILNAGEGASFPSAGDFWIRISESTTIEICKATARSTDTLTVTRAQDGTSASSITTAAIITEVVTAAALNQLRQDICQTGADASKSAEKAGNLYLPNNGFQIYRDGGSAFTPWGPLFTFTAPVSGDFAWINQGGATVTTTNGGIVLYAPANSGDSNRIRKMAAPATPYTVTAFFLCQSAAASKFGIGFRQSSDGKMDNLQLENTGGAIQLARQKMTNETSFSANYNTLSSAISLLNGPGWWFQISDDGTNRIMRISSNGLNWTAWDSQTRTNFLTADEVLFYCSSTTTFSDAYLTLLSWVIT